jgi:small subunit ribosomal protein S27Ae
MQIFVHHLNGVQQIVEVSESSTLASLYETLGLSQDVSFVYEGHFLSTLESLREQSNLYLTAGLDGGKKKKKKKAYTTKKKNKHIHKKVKLHTLSLYGVDAKGNVTYNKKPCPNCGPGLYMAKHWDRFYCGTCHTTIRMDPETIRINEEAIKKKRAALEAEKKQKEKEAADKAPAKGVKKDAKAAKKGKK